MPFCEDANPLANDSKLRRLLDDVDAIKSDALLARWRKSFLSRYQEYLDPDGVLNAHDADARLVKKLQGLARASMKVKNLISSRNIGKRQVTAEGQRGLTNLTDKCQQAEIAINAFCPKTSANEKTVGYDKFELGAVLIKDGFQAYEVMTMSRDFIRELLAESLDGILDRNSKSIIEFYFRGVQSFIDVMADLGLVRLADQCVEIYKEAARPKPSEQGPNGEPAQDDYSEFVGGGGDGDRRGDAAAPKSRGDDAKSSTKKKKKKKQAGKKPKTGTSTKASREGHAGRGDPCDSEEDSDNDGDEQDGQGGNEGATILYWDPITGSLGRVPRTTVERIVGKGRDNASLGKGISDSNEKTELIWKLKKLERQLDKEEADKPSWLDEIKREKAARTGSLKSGR